MWSDRRQHYFSVKIFFGSRSFKYAFWLNNKCICLPLILFNFILFFQFKLIVDLWSQFRYGIYPEYPAKNGETNNEFYINQNGEIEPTRCNASIQGKIKNKNTNKDCEIFLADGLPSPECIFEEETNLNYLKLVPPSLIQVNTVL